MIDSFKVFESLVASFQLTQPTAQGDWRFHKLREFEQEKLSSGQVRRNERVLLWYLHESNKPTFKGFVDKLNGWLLRESHPTSPRMINALIEVIVHLMSRKMSLMEAIKKLHGRLKIGDVSHFTFLPSKLPPEERGGHLKFGGFEFGILDLKPLERRCQKAGSDFFELYGKELDGKPTISSPIYKRVMFDLVIFLHQDPNLTWESPIYQVTLRYFEALAAEHFEMAWSDFSEKKLMVEAFGYSILDEEVFRRLPGLYKVTIYLNFNPADHVTGYVVPEIATKVIAMPQLGELQTKLESLEQIYRFGETTASALTALLQSVCRSVVTSRRFRSEQKLDEAYLHQVIALEQAFSEKEKTTQAVGGRTAMLVHRQLGMSFPDAKKLIVKLYDARSLFVHRGKKVPPELLDQIEPVALALLKSLIHLCRQPESASGSFSAVWLKKLDFMIAGFEAGIEPTNELAVANGLIEPDDAFLP